jgi:hypothetical protein
MCLFPYSSGVHLETDMVHTDLRATRRNRKVHAGIVQHPFRVVRLDARRFRGEQLRIERDTGCKIVTMDVDLKPLDGGSLSAFA